MNRALRRRRDKQARQAGQAGPALQRAMQLHNAGRLADAERAYRRVLQTDAANIGAIHLLGVVRSRRGDHAHGAELIQRSIRAHAQPPPSYHFNLGKALEGQGAFDEAATAYRLTLKAEPDNAEALNNLGNVLFAAGQTDAAFDAYRRALAAQPRAAAPRRNLCERLLQAGRLDEAAEVARTALAQDSRAADIHAVLGRIAAAQGRRDDAIAAFRASLDLDSADPYNAAMELAALDAADVPDKAPAAFIRRHYGERAPPGLKLIVVRSEECDDRDDKHQNCVHDPRGVPDRFHVATDRNCSAGQADGALAPVRLWKRQRHGVRVCSGSS